MFDTKPWPVLRADIESWIDDPTNREDKRDRAIEAMAYDAVRAVDAHVADFLQATKRAAEDIERSAANVKEFAEGNSPTPGINTLGILHGRNGDMDRAAARLDDALAHAHRICVVIGVSTKKDEAVA